MAGAAALARRRAAEGAGVPSVSLLVALAVGISGSWPPLVVARRTPGGLGDVLTMEPQASNGPTNALDQHVVDDDAGDDATDIVGSEEPQQSHQPGGRLLDGLAAQLARTSGILRQQRPPARGGDDDGDREASRGVRWSEHVHTHEFEKTDGDNLWHKGEELALFRLKTTNPEWWGDELDFQCGEDVLEISPLVETGYLMVRIPGGFVWPMQVHVLPDHMYYSAVNRQAILLMPQGVMSIDAASVIWFVLKLDNGQELSVTCNKVESP